MATTQKSLRSRELAAIHIAKKQLGLEDDDYRDLLEEWTGKRSAGKLTVEERRRVIEHFRRMGFGKTPGSCSPPPSAAGAAASSSPSEKGTVVVGPEDSGQVRMIKGLWLQLHRLGGIDTPSQQALDSFVKRQTKSSALRFTRPQQRSRIIEALKGWIERVKREG